MFSVAVSMVLLALVPAKADDGQRFDIEVTVVTISDKPGKVDSKAKRIHAVLQAKFRYQSLRVLDQLSLALEIDEVGSVKMPDGKMFRVQPLNLGTRGLLMAVGLEGAMMMDMRAPSHHLMVIGGPSYQDGQLVISIEPSY